ncbi:efflux RND transporter periplasmic adaptor subunit [Terricaulis sp.]|uniref:efflux RND transporter periplasmic adaptor subunit n=1 Tax=Terricaulis sp. TaxID=2768686 RepID=UPI002AC45305|nr:efflux RND transporter periplasmic adaptor subunit [Terricaulis sp.]MDZ4691519.1 efflux RND transporter periplasmic adaptor subunit [Terricaulis sp.]
MEPASASGPTPPPVQEGGWPVMDGMRRRLAALWEDPQRRPLIIGAVFLCAALVAGLGWYVLRPPEIAVLEIQQRPVEIALSVVGRVRPSDLIDVRSPNAGQVVRLLHDDGDRVAAGEPLAIIRSTIEQAQTEASRARERAAQAEVTRARLAFSRTRTLADRGFASSAALDESRAVLQSAEATLAAAAAERRAAASQAGEFTIRAPMAGVVLVRPIDNGQVIGPETTLFQLGSGDDLELQADVDEAYADALRPGMSARAALSGSDEIFAARISEVSPRIDPTTGGRLVKLTPLARGAIPPGRSVDVTIVVGRREDGVIVPRQAVLDATTEPKVYVVDQDGRVRVRAIAILDWPSLNAIIESGLVAGDRVVLTPTQTRPSARVRARAAVAQGN